MSGLVPHILRLGAGLVQAAERHPELVLVSSDSTGATGIGAFRDRYPERSFEMGIAEANMIMTAAGLAASGKIAFAAGLANFVALRCSEQIRTFVAHTRLNVKIIGSLSGLSAGKEGVTHEACEDLAHMRSVPELTVLAPTDAVSAEKAIVAAADWEGPVYIRVGRGPSEVIYDESYVFRIGKADRHRNGTRATIISTGLTLPVALEGADALNRQGLDVRVLDMQTVKPLDVEAVLAAARETGAIVTVEEHTIIGGLGGAVAEFLSENHPTPVMRIGVRDVYAETGKPEELYEVCGITAESIVRAVRRALELKR